MAFRHNASRFHVFLLHTLLLLSTTPFSLAARQIPPNAKTTPNQDVPVRTESFIGSDGHVHLPPLLGGGHSIGVPGSEYHQYIPGLDDNIVQNPGFEIPNPFAGHASPATARP